MIRDQRWKVRAPCSPCGTAQCGGVTVAQSAQGALGLMGHNNGILSGDDEFAFGPEDISFLEAMLCVRSNANASGKPAVEVSTGPALNSSSPGGDSSLFPAGMDTYPWANVAQTVDSLGTSNVQGAALANNFQVHNAKIFGRNSLPDTRSSFGPRPEVPSSRTRLESSSVPELAVPWPWSQASASAPLPLALATSASMVWPPVGASTDRRLAGPCLDDLILDERLLAEIEAAPWPRFLESLSSSAVGSALPRNGMPPTPFMGLPVAAATAAPEVQPQHGTPPHTCAGGPILRTASVLPRVPDLGAPGPSASAGPFLQHAVSSFLSDRLICLTSAPLTAALSERSSPPTGSCTGLAGFARATSAAEDCEPPFHARAYTLGLAMLAGGQSPVVMLPSLVPDSDGGPKNAVLGQGVHQSPPDWRFAEWDGAGAASSGMNAAVATGTATAVALPAPAPPPPLPLVVLPETDVVMACGDDGLQGYMGAKPRVSTATDSPVMATAVVTTGGAAGTAAGAAATQSDVAARDVRAQSVGRTAADGAGGPSEAVEAAATEEDAGGDGADGDPADGAATAVIRNRATVTLETLRTMYDMPAQEVVRALGISSTDLKHRCRSLGIRRWPQRKMVSLRHLAQAIKEDHELTAEERQMVLDRVEENRAQIFHDPHTELDPALKTLRQVQYKRRFLERRGIINPSTQSAAATDG